MVVSSLFANTEAYIFEVLNPYLAKCQGLLLQLVDLLVISLEYIATAFFLWPNVLGKK